MPSVTLRHERETFESLHRRFKRAVEKEGILQEVRDREFYEKPSATKKRAKAAACKRNQRQVEFEKMTMVERQRFEQKKAEQLLKRRSRGKKPEA